MIHAGIAGAEIVQRDFDSEILKRGQDCFGYLNIADERVFRDLDFEARSRETRFGEDGEDLYRQKPISELKRREVNRDEDVRRPTLGFETGRAKQRECEIRDKAEFLCQGNEG